MRVLKIFVIYLNLCLIIDIVMVYSIIIFKYYNNMSDI